MSTRALGGYILALLVLILAFNSLYIVNEFQRGVKLYFGRVVDDDIKPGLHAKIPFAEQVRKFDARILTLDARAERFLTVEKKSMIVDSYAKWRIVDAGKYYTATSGDEIRAVLLLEQRINEGLRNEFAIRNLHEVVSGERDLLMEEITKKLDEFMRSSLGIEVVDVRVKRIDLPEEISDPVFARMRAERREEANEARERGRKEAVFLEAEAERQKVIMIAEAYKEAELLRGEGDAQAAAVYAEAHNKDPEFYAFVRSLDAYKNTFSSKNDILLLDPKSDFFKYLNNVKGK